MKYSGRYLPPGDRHAKPMTTETNSNPFLDTSFAIRWSLLKPDLIKPAVETSLQEAQNAIDEISAQNKRQLTFQNTLLALEKATENMDVLWGKVEHLDAVCNASELRKAYNEMLPTVTAFYAKIPLDPNLWQVIKTYADTSEAKSLTGTRLRFLEETLADFRAAGADLPSNKKHRLEQIQQELAQKTQKFSENVLDSTNQFEILVLNKGQLKGLPKMPTEQARLDALKKGKGTENYPKWRFTLHMPSHVPAMKYLESDTLRKKLWGASNNVGHANPYDNTELVSKIIALRQEKAELLGKQCFADHVLERRMAKNGRAALDFIEDLHQRIKTAFKRECLLLEKYKAKETGKRKAPLDPWEVAFWSEKMRLESYGFNEEELRPYFPIDRVIQGMFEIVETIYNINIKEKPSIFTPPAQEEEGIPFWQTLPPWGIPQEVWSEEVKYYEILNQDDELLGAFYTDWHPRESKRGGAWMVDLMTGGPTPEGRIPHLGVICGNLTPPMEGKPALLTHREVQTIFHEFGHLLHHLLGEVEIKSLNGVNVAWDFVELPSQIMENWCWDRQSLNRFARHFETGDAIPDEMFERMIKARNFQSARETMRQLSLAKMDIEMHMHHENFVGHDIESVLATMLEDYEAPYRTRPPSLVRRFSHLFSSSTGYAAGYYSYKWAEVLDADAFTRFKKEGALNPQIGMEFREKILSKGNAEDPAKLFHDFMGRDPDLNALLERSGLL